MKFAMTSKDDFGREDSLKRYLARQLAHGRLALVLGAGISIPFGLPDWKELAAKMLKLAKLAGPEDRAPDLQIEWVRHEKFERDPKAFIGALHRALYQGVAVDFRALRSRSTLAAIAALVMASRRGSVGHVINFNFDDILELYLSYHGFVTTSTYRADTWVGYADVTVYHPHGLVPLDISMPHSDKVVLDRQEYSRVIGDDKNPWRQLMLSGMRQRTCLFIGLSGDDQDLDSIVEACGKLHACSTQRTPYWGVTFSTANDRARRAQWESRGVYYKRIRDYENHLPEFLFGICQEAAALATTSS